jgi:hypothetical protein
VADIAPFARLVAADHGLAVLSVARPDCTVSSSVVNAGVLPHPVSGDPVAAVVAIGGSRKLEYLRAARHATVALRAGWQWAAMEGPAELAGPDDALDDIAGDRLRMLLREIFIAAGGTHDDWDTYDRVMAEQRRTAVLITPRRVYGTR